MSVKRVKGHFQFFDFCSQQIDVETEVCWSGYGILNVRFGSFFSKDGEGDLKEAEQHFSWTSISCRFGSEERECCSEMRFGSVSCGSDRM